MIPVCGSEGGIKGLAETEVGEATGASVGEQGLAPVWARTAQFLGRPGTGAGGIGLVNCIVEVEVSGRDGRGLRGIVVHLHAVAELHDATGFLGEQRELAPVGGTMEDSEATQVVGCRQSFLRFTPEEVPSKSASRLLEVALGSAMPNTDNTAGLFPLTIWTSILKARDGDEQTRLAALERLLNRYYTPIYQHVFASLSGDYRTPENAKDLTQGFIAQCLRLEFLKNVSPDKGRFRTFIRECVKRYLRDDYKRRTARLRDERLVAASLDETDAEGNAVVKPVGELPAPDTQLDRAWALSVLDQSLGALGRECVSARKGELFEALKSHLGRAPDAGTSAEIGARLGMNEGAVKVELHRLRKRLGVLISEEVRQTVGTQEDWREELKYLIQLLGQ